MNCSLLSPVTRLRHRQSAQRHLYVSCKVWITVCCFCSSLVFATYWETESCRWLTNSSFYLRALAATSCQTPDEDNHLSSFLKGITNRRQDTVQCTYMYTSMSETMHTYLHAYLHTCIYLLTCIPTNIHAYIQVHAQLHISSFLKGITNRRQDTVHVIHAYKHTCNHAYM